MQTDYANITDVPAYPWAYASVLSAAGVKYFAAGANDDRGPQPLYGRWQTRSPFWWQGPDGAKVLMAYTRQYSNLWFICGLPPREAAAARACPRFLQTFESPGYQPDTVSDVRQPAGKHRPDPRRGRVCARAGTRSTPGRACSWRLSAIISRLIEKNYGDKLETVRGDFGPYWEDGIGTDAQYAAALPADRKPRARGRDAVLASRRATARMGAAARPAPPPVAAT